MCSGVVRARDASLALHIDSPLDRCPLVPPASVSYLPLQSLLPPYLCGKLTRYRFRNCWCNCFCKFRHHIAPEQTQVPVEQSLGACSQDQALLCDLLPVDVPDFG